MADGYGFGARRRLEDRGAVAGDEGHGARACPAEPRSWRTIPIISRPDGHLVLGAHMLEVCPSIAEASPRSRFIRSRIGARGRPGPPGVQRARRAGAQRNPDRPRRAFPPDCQRGDRGRSPGRCRSCRSRARSGNASPTSRRPARPGFWPAARTTPASATAVTAEMLEDFATIAGIELVADRRRRPVSGVQAGPAQQRRLLLSGAGLPGLIAGRSCHHRTQARSLRGQCRAAAAWPDQPDLRQRQRDRPRPRRVRDQAERGRLCRAVARRHGGRRSRRAQGRGPAQAVVGHADPSPAVPRLSERSAASCTPIRRTRPPSPRPAGRFRSSAPPTPIISTARCPSPAR